MIQVAVNINYISAEKFWEQGKPLPPGVHISTNVNLVGLEPRGDKLSVPFVVTINYTPAVAQISLKGQALVSGDKRELEKLQENYRKRQPPPQALLRSITSASLVEAVLLSRTLNVPPPIPMPAGPPPKPSDKERPSYVG